MTAAPYAFGGALFCGVRQRRMQGHWINSAPYYRCRFPNEYALANKISHPRNVYLREDAFDARVTDWLATALAPGRLDETIDQMTAAQPAADDGTQAEAAREKAAIGGRATHHSASLQVFAEGDGRTRLLWITDLLPDELDGPIREMVEQGAEVMKRTLESGENLG